MDKIKQWIKDLLNRAKNAAIESAKNSLKSLLDLAARPFKALWAKIKELFNKLKSKIGL